MPHLACRGPFLDVGIGLLEHLAEVVDGTIAYINNNSIEIDELITHIKAPDFPTGGFVCGREGVRDAYRTGRGRVVMRARADIEQIDANSERIVVTEPGEWRVLEMMQGWEQRFGVPVEIRADDRFLSSLAAFGDWANGRKSLRMEFFYREMRRKTGWLMEDGQPLGGRWNYDADNRKAFPKGMSLPPRERFEPDDTTRGVINLVQRRFPEAAGNLQLVLQRLRELPPFVEVYPGHLAGST